MFKCKHKFEKKVDDKGYQYCKICGSARHVKREEEPCSHKWHNVEARESRVFNIYSGNRNVADIIYVLQCTKCGEMKNHKLTK